MDDDTSATENTAIALFRQGIKHECEANNVKAVRCYKQALKMDPDVERKIEHGDAPSSGPTDTFGEIESDDDNDQETDLFSKFQRLLGSQLCSADRAQKNTHISSLPPEMFLYIFRWVVSSDLDLRSSEQCAAVCRGWYLCARDPDLWRRASSKFWPPDLVGLAVYNDNWRKMYIERPHVLTIGCYISKVSYVRRGEESFIDNRRGLSYDVDYYRYLRFFSNGRVLMVITNEAPKQIVRTLQTREKAPNNVCCGYYELCEDKLILSLFKSKGYEKNSSCKCYTETDINYKMVLRISKYKSKYNRKLHWVSYELICYNSIQNNEVGADYELSKNRFPPFVFSRVKCYANESKQIL